MVTRSKYVGSFIRSLDPDGKAQKGLREGAGSLLERRIFAPLGMAATRHSASTVEDIAGLAVGYLPLPSGGWRRAQHRFALGGEGGLISAVPDLARWHRWLSSPAGETIARGLSTVLPFTRGTVGSDGRGVELSE